MNNWSCNISFRLTSDQDETRPDDILPECLVIAGLESLHEVVVPSDINGHVARKSMRNKDSKGQHSLDDLSESARKNICQVINKIMVNF